MVKKLVIGREYPFFPPLLQLRENCTLKWYKTKQAQKLVSCWGPSFFTKEVWPQMDCLAQVSGHSFGCFLLVCVVSWPLSSWTVLFRNLAEVVWLAPNHVSCPLLFAFSFPDSQFSHVLVLYMSQLGFTGKNLLIIGTGKGLIHLLQL